MKDNNWFCKDLSTGFQSRIILFHLISFTYFAWVGSICHVDTFLRYRVFHGRNRMMRVCIAKDKIGGSRVGRIRGVQWGSREHSEFVLLCPQGGGDSLHKPLWCTLSTQWAVQWAGGGYKCCSSSITPDPVNLSHFCRFTQDRRASSCLESQTLFC